MTFKEWLKQRELGEVATSTASVAGFARPIGPMIRRGDSSGFEVFGKKKKKKKKRT